MPTLLTIAGFDPSSGAGVTADLSVFHAHGLFGTACITALTVQSTVGVVGVHCVDPVIVRHTLDHLDADLAPDGIKIGMLGNAACVEIVADYLERLSGVGRRPVVVLDPVLRASSGRALLAPEGVEILRVRLLPWVDWVTPNLQELEVLGDMELGMTPLRESIREAVSFLRAECPSLGIMVTGGDQEPPDDLVWSCTNSDPAAEPFWLAGERVETTSTHGTGCALSSALLCRLALGDAPFLAAAGAKRYVTGALRHASALGSGRGPMNLLWPLMPECPA